MVTNFRYWDIHHVALLRTTNQQWNITFSSSKQQTSSYKMDAYPGCHHHHIVNPLSVVTGKKLRLALDLTHVNPYQVKSKFKYDNLRCLSELLDQKFGFSRGIWSLVIIMWMYVNFTENLLIFLGLWIVKCLISFSSFCLLASFLHVFILSNWLECSLEYRGLSETLYKFQTVHRINFLI